MLNSIYLDGAGKIRPQAPADVLLVAGYAASYSYQSAVILRGSGALNLVKGGAYSDWTLVWATSVSAASPLYATLFNYNKAMTLDYIRVRQLPAPFDTDDGLLTLNVTSPADATEYIGDANGILEVTVTAPGSLDGSAATRCGFYYRADADLTPAWHAYVNGLGVFNLDSISADGTRTNRISVAGVITGGTTRTIRVICDGAAHSAYSLAGTTWTQHGAEITLSLNDAATTIEPSIPAGWSAANLRSYPRTAAAYAELDRGETTGNTYLTSMPGKKAQHQMDVYNGKLYAVGGESESGAASPKKLYAYDPALDNWDTLTDLSFAQAERQSAGWRAAGSKLYFIGGYTSPSAVDVHAEVFEYDPALNTWATKTSMPTAREDFATFVIDGKIHCVGGIAAGTIVLTTHEVYDPALDSWDTLEPLPVAKLLGNFGAAINGKGYVVGGTDTMVGYPTLAPVNTVYEYDPVGDSWTAKAVIPALGCYRDVVAMNGKLYVIGGTTTQWNLATNTVIYVYDPTTNAWSTGGVLPYAVSGVAAAAYNGSLYMCGGYVNGTATADLWRLAVT